MGRFSLWNLEKMKTITKILYSIPSQLFLIICVCMAYLPFLNSRVLRMAGDEKVYVSTAIEMERAGHWFMQTLAGTPNYFKGPLHYWFVRIGLLFFGNQLIAGLWMNFVLVLLASLATYHLGKKIKDDQIGLLLGLSCAFNIGVFSHAFASQMEVELYALYTFAAVSLGLGTYANSNASKTPFKPKHDFWFWIFAGIAGWVKSPLHSVLIGAGGIFYWLISKQIKFRIRSINAWLAAFLGIMVCLAGYLPIFILDWDAFYQTYILREQLEKVNNQRSWTYVMSPLLHFSLPWTCLLLTAFFIFFKKKLYRDRHSFLPQIAVFFTLPTLLFWCFWTYKGQNYNLPALGALFFVFAFFLPEKVYRFSLQSMGFLGLLFFIACIVVLTHFWPLPPWWNFTYPILGLMLTLFFALVFLSTIDLRWVALGCVSFFLAFAALITPLGERELIGIREFIARNPNVQLHYYDLEPNIWCEWGLLQLALHRPIQGLHHFHQLPQALGSGHAILVQTKDSKNNILNYFNKQNQLNRESRRNPEVIPWTRWLTKGKSPQGNSRWNLAWQNKDLSLLEREFYILYFP